jgi:hypothetical protein
MNGGRGTEDQTAFTGKQPTHGRSNPLKIADVDVPSYAVNHLAPGISVERAAAIRFQVFGPGFYVSNVRTEIRNPKSEMPITLPDPRWRLE